MPFLTQGQTNWKFIGIVLVLAIIVGSGILWCIEQQKAPLAEFPETESLEDETSGWQTYRNEKYGFEFKYPENLIIDEADNQIILKLSEEDPYRPVWIMIFNNPREYGIEEFYNFYSVPILPHENLEIAFEETGHGVYFNPYEFSETKEIEIDGIAATNFLSIVRDEVIPVSFVSISYGDLLIEIGTYPFEKESVKLHGQILSTFRFID